MDDPRVRRRSPGLVITRELGRVAKRWQRVPLRVGLVAILLVIFVVTLLISQEVMAPGEAARVGKRLFDGSYLALVLATAIVPAALVIQAVQGERDGGALDLLALTGIPPGRVLWGLLGSRGLRAFLLLAAVAPLLALIPTLGGVSTESSIAALMALVAVFLTTTAVSGFLAIPARSMPVAVIATAGWWLVVPILASLRLAVVVGQVTGSSPTYVFPTAHALDPPQGDLFQLTTGLGLVPWITTATVAVIVAGWCFRRGISSGWGAQTKSWPGLRWGWIVHLPLQIGGWYWLESHYATGQHGVLNTPIDAIYAQAVMIGLLTSASILYLRAMSWLLPRLGLSRRWMRIPVLGDAIVWRELFTNAQGGLSRAVAIATFGWVVIALLLVATVGRHDEELFIMWSVVAALATIGMSVVLLTASIMEERSRRTLPLLVSTTLRPWAIVRGKVVATLLRCFPLVLLGSLLMFYAEPAVLGVPGGRVAWGEQELLHVHVLTNLPYIRGAAILAWCGSLWLTMLAGAALCAIQFRNRGLAWALPGLFAAVLLFGLPMAFGLLQGVGQLVPYARDLQILVFPLPFMLDRQYMPGTPVGSILSAVFWLSTATVLLALASRQLGKIGTQRQ